MNVLLWIRHLQKQQLSNHGIGHVVVNGRSKKDDALHEQTGVNILKAALVQPLMLISQNTGVSGEVVLAETLKGEGDYGYDAETGEYVNLLESGIMDPAKVTRAAIENASSVAAMVLTTESLISDIPQPEAPAPAMPPMDY